MLVIRINRNSPEPVYRQVAAGIVGLVSQQVLREGEQVPSSRDFAAMLGVSRRTIDQAFSVLQADGVIESRVGRGSFVAAAPRLGSVDRRNAGLFEARQDMQVAFWKRLRNVPVSEDAFLTVPTRFPYSFVPAMPDPSLFPVQRFRRCIDWVLRNEGRRLAELSDKYGNYSLRESIVKRLARDGVCATPDQVLVTSGCQQSLDLISRLFLSANSSVAVENPGYPAAAQLFTLHGAVLVGFPVVGSTESLGDFEHRMERAAPAFVYVVPNYQNPTGVLMNEATRQGLVEVSNRLWIPIVEDDVFGELRFEGFRFASVKAFDRQGSVIYISSVSKTLSMGLRLGWIVGPRTIVSRLADLKHFIDLRTNGLLQAATDLFIRRGSYDRHLNRARMIFRRRRDILCEALEKYLPTNCVWSEPNGGLAIWVTVDERINTRELLGEAQRVGVDYSPGDLFYCHSPRRNQFRLGYGVIEDAAIEEGIRRLGGVLQSAGMDRKSA